MKTAVKQVVKQVARACWLIVQAAFGCAALAWLIATRRGRPFILTHHQDRDAAGRDRQLGPLLDTLGARRIEVAFVPGTALATWRRLRPGAGLVIPYATLRLIARVLGPISRDPSARAARWLLEALRPPVAFLIDESGSGQPFVRAARALGIRTVGIQHGDFAAGNPQYDGASAREIVAADVLCVWSAWFQARLLRISTIYTSANTRVTGRLRDPAPTTTPRDDDAVRVLVIGEADPDFAATVDPYLAALRAAGDVVVKVQPHPAESTRGRDLATALAWSDVVVGRRSSALLEALWHARPIVIVGVESAAHEFFAAGLATACAQPTALAAICRTICRTAEAGSVDPARAGVWGGAPADPVRAIVAAAAGAAP